MSGLSVDFTVEVLALVSRMTSGWRFYLSAAWMMTFDLSISLGVSGFLEWLQVELLKQRLVAWLLCFLFVWSLSFTFFFKVVPVFDIKVN